MSDPSPVPAVSPPTATTGDGGATTTTTAEPAQRAGSAGPLDAGGGVWSPARRRLTAGLVLTVTLVAFESLAISTVLPEVSDDLGGLGLYGWVFSGFFLGSLLGIVVAGQLSDQRGAWLPFVLGLSLFSVGLVVGGAAQSMGMLVAGRVAQGIGAGAIPAVAYASVGRTYPPSLQPRVFAVFSTAWVVPGLIGPVAATTIAEALSWRAVFWALLPLVGVAAAMTLPALTRAAPDRAAPAPDATAVDPTAAVGHGTGVPTGTDLTAVDGDGRGGEGARPPAADGDPTDVDPAGGNPTVAVPTGVDGDGHGGDGARPAADRRRDALVLVAGTALVLVGLGAGSVPLAAAFVVVGLGPAVWAFLRLVPAGTVRLVPGMPAAVAVRGILTFAFFGSDLYVSLAITDGRGRSTWLAGAGLTAATLLWTTGSWVQQRIVGRVGPRWLVQRGFVLVAAGIAGMLLVLQPVPPWLVVPLWGLAGLGMGISYAPLSVTVLSLAEPGHEGTASSSLQLSDVLGVALGTGLSGVFVALGEGREWATTTSLTFAFVLTGLVAVAGVLAAGRLPRRLPSD